MITEAWYDRGSGGFYTNYKAIPEAHRKSPGRIVRMVVAEDEPLYSLGDIADACMYADVPDSKFESIAIALRSRKC
jgi:hypothetical protein